MGGRRGKSKRRSGSKTQLEPPTFFLDECVDCASLAEALVNAGARVERHRDHFEPGTPDVELLDPVSARGWLFLTADKRQKIRALERQALVEAGARQFVLRGKGLTGQELGRRAASHIKRMSNIARSEPAPFVAHVTKGAVKVVAKSRALRKGRPD